MSGKGNKCEHGWDGEHYQLKDGDSLKCVHEKNEVNRALDRVSGPAPDTVGEFLVNTVVDAPTLFKGPDKVADACGCNDDDKRATPGKRP